MAIKTQEELLNSIRDLLPDNTSDEAISLLEDVTDTLGSFSNANKDNEDWKKKNGKKLAMIFVTENGKEDEEIIGIITSYDLIKY